MTPKQLSKAITDFLIFQDTDQPNAPRTGAERIKWFSEKWLEEQPEAASLTKISNSALMDACKTVVDGYEGDGMENMEIRDEVFYRECKSALAQSEQPEAPDQPCQTDYSQGYDDGIDAFKAELERRWRLINWGNLDYKASGEPVYIRLLKRLINTGFQDRLLNQLLNPKP